MSFLKAVGSFLSAPFDGGASVISTGMGMANDYFAGKRKEKESKREHKSAMETANQQYMQKRALEGDFHAASLDQLSMADRGWKDDWLLILTTMPITVMFFEPLLMIFMVDQYVAGAATEAIQKGFSALNQAPVYYWYALALIYIDTFGFRRMLRVAIEQAIPRLMNKFMGKA